jgi:hypothetical protein
MIRRSIFLGLTLVLVVALIALIVRGYKMEKEQAGQPKEKIEEAKSTATRVLAPQDLEILGAKTTVAKNTDSKERSRIARHEIEIRNNGKLSYQGLQLRFTYLDRKGKETTTKIYSVTQTVASGTTLKLIDISITDIPMSTVESKAAIISADMLPPPAKEP